METIKLHVEKPECKDTCPLPLDVVPSIIKGIKILKYDKKSHLASITFDEKLLKKEEIIKKLTKMGYEVKNESTNTNNTRMRKLCKSERNA